MSNLAALQRSEKECRRLARSHYENFIVASVLLPRRLRQPFYNVYAFCRTADDLADESESPQQALADLATFRQRLDDTFAGNPPTLENSPNPFPALAHTVEQFQLNKQPFDDLLSAFEQDQHKTRYENFDALADYCRRSANPVGRIVLQLADCYEDENVAASDDICTGLQLANFWQDVARDWSIGRLYLPQDEMRSFDVDESMLSADNAADPLKQLLRSECDRAKQFFDRGRRLADRVPLWFSGDVKLFVYGGLATLDAIGRADYDVLAGRPKVGKLQQAWLVARAACGR
ncbi:MAG: squalene synthase HpnC [Pirellulaceae bacterium]|nr:squalene synthase HpnC [Pirellulaceae bacterium]